jgi:hypothetical protein
MTPQAATTSPTANVIAKSRFIDPSDLPLIAARRLEAAHSATRRF